MKTLVVVLVIVAVLVLIAPREWHGRAGGGCRRDPCRDRARDPAKRRRGLASRAGCPERYPAGPYLPQPTRLLSRRHVAAG
jgi:hypothetical protein